MAEPPLGTGESIPRATRHRREEIWFRAVEAQLRSGDQRLTFLITSHADDILAAFEERFGGARRVDGRTFEQHPDG